MEDLLSQEAYSYQRPKRGELRIGQVVLVGPNEIVVDVGAKREAVVSAQDLQRLSAEERAALSVGDQISVCVVNPEDRDGNIIVSIYLAQVEQDWQRAEEYLASKEIVEEKVIGYNKGGLVVPFGRIRGFVPASQLVGFPRRLSPDQKVERLAQQVGRNLVGQIIEVDRKRKRMIMSEQAAQGEWRARKQRELMDSLVEGQVVRGVVTSLANFGAFVDLGGAEGLVHISELAWHRVKHPREVLKVGDAVEVYILKLDRANHKIGLSMRRLQPDPWSLVDTKYFIDQRVVGKITNVTDFGAFAHLEDGIEGLIHISELTEGAINHPSEVVKRGDRYLLEIIKIEPERQRIGLSLKRVPAEEQSAWRASQPAARARSAGRPAPAEPKPAPAEPVEMDATAAGEMSQVVEPPREPAAADTPEAGQGTQNPESESVSPALSADDSQASGEPQPETLVEEPVA
jgi:small subunit ribosomal protein S1